MRKEEKSTPTASEEEALRQENDEPVQEELIGDNPATAEKRENLARTMPDSRNRPAEDEQQVLEQAAEEGVEAAGDDQNRAAPS